MTNLRIRIEQITERLRRATDAYLDGTFEKELFEERKQAFLVERQTAQNTLDEFAANRVTVHKELLEEFERAGSAYSLYEKSELGGTPSEIARTWRIILPRLIELFLTGTVPESSH